MNFSHDSKPLLHRWLEGRSAEQKKELTDALTKAFKEGIVNPATYVWHEEMPEWKPLKDTLRPVSIE